jgi:hypothetical protein
MSEQEKILSFELSGEVEPRMLEVQPGGILVFGYRQGLDVEQIKRTAEQITNQSQCQIVLLPDDFSLDCLCEECGKKLIRKAEGE